MAVAAIEWGIAMLGRFDITTQLAEGEAAWRRITGFEHAARDDVKALAELIFREWIHQALAPCRLQPGELEQGGAQGEEACLYPFGRPGVSEPTRCDKAKATLSFMEVPSQLEPDYQFLGADVLYKIQEGVRRALLDLALVMVNEELKGTFARGNAPSVQVRLIKEGLHLSGIGLCCSVARCKR